MKNWDGINHADYIYIYYKRFWHQFPFIEFVNAFDETNAKKLLCSRKKKKKTPRSYKNIFLMYFKFIEFFLNVLCNSKNKTHLSRGGGEWWWRKRVREILPGNCGLRNSNTSNQMKIVQLNSDWLIQVITSY